MEDQFAHTAVAECDCDEARAVLAGVGSLTGMGFAAVARVTEDRSIACQVLDNIAFGLTAGGELDISMTICDEIRQHGEEVVFNDAIDADWRLHPGPIFYGFKSYASFFIRLTDGKFYRTLCAIDAAHRKVSSREVVSIMRQLADRVAIMVEAHKGVAGSQREIGDQAFSNLRSRASGGVAYFDGGD